MMDDIFLFRLLTFLILGFLSIYLKFLRPSPRQLDFSKVHRLLSYFPIFVDAEKYGMTRDELYEKMRMKNVWGRRYFYPLISEFSTYRGLESATSENLPQATKMAESVICLPMHHLLRNEDVNRVLDCVLK